MSSPFRWASLLSSAALVACAGLGAPAPEDQVRVRANERWRALLASEFTKAYGYSSSGFKAVVKAENFPFRVKGPVDWLDAEVASVSCPDTVKCVVKVRIDYKPLLVRGSGKVSTYVDETWLNEDGQWWIFLAI